MKKQNSVIVELRNNMFFTILQVFCGIFGQGFIIMDSYKLFVIRSNSDMYCLRL